MPAPPVRRLPHRCLAPPVLRWARCGCPATVRALRVRRRVKSRRAAMEGNPERGIMQSHAVGVVPTRGRLAEADFCSNLCSTPREQDRARRSSLLRVDDPDVPATHPPKLGVRAKPSATSRRPDPGPWSTLGVPRWPASTQRPRIRVRGFAFAGGFAARSERGQACCEIEHAAAFCSIMQQGEVLFVESMDPRVSRDAPESAELSSLVDRMVDSYQAHKALHHLDSIFLPAGRERSRLSRCCGGSCSRASSTRNG